MTKEDQSAKLEELKELIRTEPTIAATFADIEAEHTAASEHTKTLANKRKEARLKLDAIAAAKEEVKKLVAAAPVAKKEPEPAAPEKQEEPAKKETSSKKK